MLTRSLAGRRGWVAWALLCGGLFASACSGGDDDDTPSGIGTGNTGNTANRTGKGGSGGGFGDGGMGEGNTGGMGETDALAPVVEVVSPVAETDPNGTGVLVDDELDVVCRATRSPEKGSADVAAVVVDMLDAEGKVVDTVAASDDGSGEHTYAARVITAKVPDNGVIGFRCTAADDSTPPRTASATITTFIDHGPSVEFSNPDREDQPIALGHPLKIVFTVKEQPVARSGDDGAAVGDVSMTVRDVPFDLDEKNGEYSATIHLDDAELFPNAPEGSVPIIVQAGNRRMPVASVNEVTRHVIVDGAGPVVTITDPKGESVRGGKVTLTFTAVDEESGVDPDSIKVTLNDVPYRYSVSSDDWTQDGDTYTFNFDTTQIEGSVVQATIAVTATDKVGNASKDEAIVLYLDNQPPLVDLDPPPVREWVKGSEQCSLAFDPVGPYAANDLATVLRLQKFRALVWDRTNTGDGQTDFYYSGTNLDSAIIRLQPNVDQGLLIDTDGDGYCDDLLNEDDATPPAALPYQPLHAVTPKGSSWISSAADDALASEFPMPSFCKYATDHAKPPEGLCPPTNNDDMTRVISWDVDETVPAIFGVGSLSPACTGTDWEIGPVVKEGWICVAGRAEDNTGNVGISRPLRLCYDDKKGDPPSCLDQDADPPPSCRVNNCKLPPTFYDHYVLVKN
jgi:hypothetical protein